MQEIVLIYCMFPVPAELPPPDPVRVSPRYIVLNTGADLVLEAKFRGNFWIHDWVYSDNDPYLRGFMILFNATRTNIGQTFTIPAGSTENKAGYFGPRIIPMFNATNQLIPTPKNAVIVGSFSRCTADCIQTQQLQKKNVMDLFVVSVPVTTHILNCFTSTAVAPTTLINGLATAQVTAAAGDNVTFTCLASGFPETTLNIQLSGVTALYTIGDQTLMTEATPTSFMEVTRTVTLHNVTALDCGAVVTCVGSNMNSDGSTHTDQAAATLQVQGERG